MVKTGNRVGIFISYDHEDRFIAETLAGRLREVGYQPWVDFAGIMGGDKWKRSIDNALIQSAAFLVLMTPESIDSEYVSYEVERAIDKHCPIIPLLIRNCNIPSALEVYQYVDFRAGIDHAMKDLQRALLTAVVRGGITDDDATEPSIPIRLVKPGAIPSDEDTAPVALVIEDATSTQEMLRDLLVDMGLDVHIAKTRNEATTLIQTNRYDFVTLDMQLGPDDQAGQEGVYLLDMLKRYQDDVPVVMITYIDYDKNQTAEFFRTGRIKDMLDKPFDHSRLRALVAQHVKGVRK